MAGLLSLKMTQCCRLLQTLELHRDMLLRCAIVALKMGQPLAMLRSWWERGTCMRDTDEMLEAKRYWK